MWDVDGAAVRQLRKSLGLKQTELAARVGVHWATVSRWENEHVTIPVPVERLLRLLAQSAATSTTRTSSRRRKR